MAITKLATGKFKVKVFMGWKDNGGRIDKTKIVYGSKREAEKVERELKTLKDTGKVDRSTETLAEHIPKWLRSIRHQVRERTLNQYRGRFTVLLDTPLGFKELKKIKLIDIQTFFNDLYDKGYAPVTVGHLHTVLKTCLDDAVIKGKITANPMLYYKLPKRAHRDAPNAYTLQEAERILEAAKSTEHYLFFCLMLLAGLRPCEVAGLTWACVNLEHGLVKVEKTLTRFSSKRWSFEEPKTRKSKRTIAIGNFLVDLLASHKLGSQENNYDLVLTNDMLEPINIIRIRNHTFKPLKEHLGLPDYPMYNLRATHLTHFEQIAGIQATSRRAGHSNIQITSDHYLSPQLDAEKIAVKTFEEKLFNAVNSAVN